MIPVPRAFIFGAGHNSKSLSKVAVMAGFSSTVIDDREAFANSERFPEADEIFSGEHEEVFPKLTIRETSYVIIVTRGHRDDMRVLRWAVSTAARYIAMIGSKRKVPGTGERARGWSFRSIWRNSCPESSTSFSYPPR